MNTQSIGNHQHSISDSAHSHGTPWIGQGSAQGHQHTVQPGGEHSQSISPLPYIDSRVFITAHEVEGVVEAIYTGRRGIQYLVEYKDKNGAIQNQYCWPEQLRVII